MEKDWIKKLREKLENFEVPPSEGLWTRIVTVLNRKNPEIKFV